MFTYTNYIVLLFRYNILRKETHPTEFQLIIKDIENIDRLIKKAQMYVTWNSEGKQNRFLVPVLLKDSETLKL